MALSTIEKVLFLKSVPLFEQIPSEDLAGVAQIVQQVEFAPGVALIRQGDEGDCLFIIVDGEVDIVVDGFGTVNHFTAKGVLGETGILSGNPRNAHCIATTEVVTLKLEREDFWELLGERPQFALGIIKVLIAQIDNRTQNLEKLRAELEMMQAEAQSLTR